MTPLQGQQDEQPEAVNSAENAIEHDAVDILTEYPDIWKVLTVTGKLGNVGIIWVALAVNVTTLKISLIQLICGLTVIRTSVSGTSISSNVC